MKEGGFQQAEDVFIYPREGCRDGHVWGYEEGGAWRMGSKLCIFGLMLGRSLGGIAPMRYNGCSLHVSVSHVLATVQDGGGAAYQTWCKVATTHLQYGW
jgi:hypothetical protein